MNEIPSIWKKLRALLLALVIFSTNFSAMRAAYDAPDEGPDSIQSLSAPIEFTGQDHVDLMWSYTDPGYDSFRIYRDNNLIQTLSYATTFYRDAGVSFGINYMYRVCAYNSSSEAETCGLSQSASVGQISGNLRQSVSWSGSSYYIAWPVHVYSGASLNISDNAQLLSGTTKQPIDDENGGAINLQTSGEQSKVYLPSVTIGLYP